MTDDIIAKASARALSDSATNLDRLLARLSDGAWHSALELSRVAGLRFGARIADARALGIVIERRLDPNRPKGAMWYQYRLRKGGEHDG